MKLLTYGDKEEERLAAVAGDERYLIDLNIASHGTIPPDTVAFLKGDYWETAQKVLTLPPEEIRHALIER
ncbi:MAG: hypothetical protein RMK62_12255, partial [Armatimonadota bacterium]|nr:hypothetical protein [Armatimonadota bacterium]